MVFSSNFIRALTLMCLSALGYCHCLPQPLSKQGFIEHMMPLISAENKRIATIRERILSAQNTWQQQGHMGLFERHRINAWAKTYRLESFDPKQAKHWQTLTARVDTIPNHLILAQAILESGFGQSRFAKQACNFFGQQCYTPGCGLVPKQRSPGQHHEVKRFSSATMSIRAYMHNLNVHPAYQAFRATREQARHKHQPLNAKALAKTLALYAEIGHDYTKRLIQIINTLEKPL